MEYLIGVILAAGVVAFGRLVGLDRERSFYTTVLVVVASYYILFAAMGQSHHALHVELLAAVVFCALAVIGFRLDMRYVAAGLVAHGVFDLFVHQHIVVNPGVPVWWPGFCAACDVVLGVWLFFALARTKSQ